MSDLQAMLADTVARLFGARVTKERIEAAERGEWQAELWRAVEDGGLCRPHLSEAAGGAGGTWLEAYVILRAAGRHALPLPLAETMLAAWLLAGAGIEVPDGPLTIVPDVVDAAAVAGGALTVIAPDVPWARAAGHLVFVVDGAGGTRVGVVAAAAAAGLRRGANLAREPRDTLTFEHAPLSALAPVSLPADVIRLYGAMVRSAQMAGAMEALLAQAVQYAGERVQFGRAIGRFQVIQHELAKLAGDVALAGAAAEGACRAAARAERMRRDECGGGEGMLGADVPGEVEPATVDRGAGAPAACDPRFEIAVAKTRVGESVEQATSIAHQVHGAIGFTYEHGLHFLTRRLWAWRAEFGTDAHWAAVLGREAIGRGADALWPYVTSRTVAES